MVCLRKKDEPALGASQPGSGCADIPQEREPGAPSSGSSAPKAGEPLLPC